MPISEDVGSFEDDFKTSATPLVNGEEGVFRFKPREGEVYTTGAEI